MSDTPQDAAVSPATPSQVPASQVPSPELLAADVLKAALKAFKKRMKLTMLDDESQIGRSPMSSGGKSSVAGITPPDQYPRAVWDELVKQGRLKYAGSGTYSPV